MLANWKNILLNTRNKRWVFTKAELPLEGIFFALNFLPWEFLLLKKLEIEKTKTNLYTTFKTDTYNKSGFSFFDFQLFY